MTEYIINLDGELGMALGVACAGAGFVREEIVRCRYCRFASAGEAVIGGNWQIGNCHNPRFKGSIHRSNARADGFCAWGERKDA